jgi:hypothetical protein
MSLRRRSGAWERLKLRQPIGLANAPEQPVIA